MASLQIKQGLKSSYLAIAKKDANTLYFTIDTGEIFLGDLNMSQTNTCFVPEVSVQETQVNTLLDSLSSAKVGDVAVINVYFQEFSNSAIPTHYLCLGDTWAVVSCNLVKANTIKFANAISDTSKTLADIQAGKQDLTEVLSSIYSNVGEKISQQDGKISTTEQDLSSTKEKLDGAKNTAESALAATETLQDTKFDKAGGTVDGSVSINGDLTVKGKTTTEEHETVLVRDNLVILNSEKVDLQTSKSGIVIYKNNETTYGIVYDPIDDTYKFGEGFVDTEGEFHFNTNEGQPLAIRDDSSKMVDGHVIVWDAVGHKLVDGGLPVVVQPDWSQTDTAAADYIKNKPDVDAMTSYTNTEAMVIDVGGIKASDHKNGFDGVKIQEVLDELLYPDVAVKVIDFVLSNDSKIIDQQFLAPESVKYCTFLLKHGSKKIQKVSLLQFKDALSEEVELDSVSNISFDNNNESRINFYLNEEMVLGNNEFILEIVYTDSSSERLIYNYDGVLGNYLGIINDVHNLNLNNILVVSHFLQKGEVAIQHKNQLDSYPILLSLTSNVTITDENGLKQKWQYMGYHTVFEDQYHVYIGPSADLTETFHFCFD